MTMVSIAMLDPNENWCRRNFIKTTGVVSASSMIGVAGCTGNRDNSDDSDGSDNSDDSDGSDNSDNSNDLNDQDYPSQPIKLIVPFSQGGGTDTINRALVPVLSEKLGVDIQIENISGAASLRGTAQGLQANPDGNTMLAFNPPSTPISYLIHQPDFDLQDAKGVAAYAISPQGITVNPDVANEHGIESYDDLIAKYQDGTLQAFAGETIGSYYHVMALVLRERHGLEFNPDKYVPYEGSGPAVEAVASGEVPAGLGSAAAMVPFTEDDRIRVPAILTSEGSPAYPDTPTVTELGYENVDSVGQMTRCYWVPPETPPEKVDTLTSAVEEMVNDSEIQQYAEENGMQVMYRGPEYVDELLNDILDNIPSEVDMESIRDQIDN